MTPMTTMTTKTAPSTPFADKLQMQGRLFAQLSAMFGKEVPLYDKSLLVNRACNATVVALLSQMYKGFRLTTEEIDRTSGERHGAIRIGRPDEYRLIARFFAAFAMEPHNFYDMTSVGAKSQPIIATAFRSIVHPEHRVFTSLLQTNYFDPKTQARIEALLATRTVFSDKAKELLDKNERQGGLSHSDAEELIREGVERIFKWTAQARDHALYKELCDSGFKIAADIACFRSHHLNHLTPNTFSIDLYTAAMRHAMGEISADAFRARAAVVLTRMTKAADRDYMRLHFKHLSPDQVDSYPAVSPPSDAPATLAQALTDRLAQPDINLSALKHAGHKDFTEGPSQDTPILLRQDAYKALTEPVTFTNPDGSTLNTVHTARFGEIEQRFYATTPAGRDLYDQCLAKADAARDADPTLIKKDFEAYERLYAAPFAPFPKTLPELLEQKFVYGRYSPTAKGLTAAGTITTTDLSQLIKQGHVRAEGLRYEDFLPVSAAGIFASNLNQYGTQSTAAAKPIYTQKMLEDIMGRPIIDANLVYEGLQAQSLLHTFTALGLLDRLPPKERANLEHAVAALPPAAKAPAPQTPALAH